MRLRLKATQKVLLLVLVPSSIMLLLLGALAVLINNAESQAHRMERYKNTIACAESIAKDLYDASYYLALYAVSHDRTIEKQFQESIAGIHSKTDNLVEMVSSNDKQCLLALKIGVTAEKAITIGEETHSRLQHASLLSLSASFPGSGGIPVSSDFRHVMSELVGYMHEFVECVKDSEHVTPADLEATHRFVWLLLWVGGGVCVIALLLSLLFCKDLIARLNVMVENTRRLSQSQLLLSPVSGCDEISQLDKTFHSMAEALTAAERMKQEFLAMIGHDLRTPLCSMLGFLHLLSAGTFGKLNAVGENRIILVEASTSRLISLINDLLDLERLESGLMPLSKERILVDEAVQDAVEIVRQLADDRQIKIEYECNSVFAYADHARIVQVLVNLLGNAIKFSPEMGLVKLSASESTNWTEVRITDQGRGISAEAKKVIFERFKQVKESDATEKGGSGLGLSICKAIVLQHGGHIDVMSEEGYGSTFLFRLPANADGQG